MCNILPYSKTLGQSDIGINIRPEQTLQLISVMTAKRFIALALGRLAIPLFSLCLPRKPTLPPLDVKPTKSIYLDFTFLLLRKVIILQKGVALRAAASACAISFYCCVTPLQTLWS
jgi:hypothetical protein